MKVGVPLTQVTRLPDRWGATGPRFARVCYTPGRRAVPLPRCSAGQRCQPLQITANGLVVRVTAYEVEPHLLWRIHHTGRRLKL